MLLHHSKTAPMVPEFLERRQMLSTVSYDLKSQWSDSKNPNGVWTYREGTNALPHVAAWDSFENPAPAQPAWARSEGTSSSGGTYLPAWFKSTHTVADWQVGDIIVHSTDAVNGAGAGLANVAWTSPADGTVTIAGGVWAASPGSGRSNHWSLQKNSTTLTEGDIFDGDPFSRAQPFKYSTGSSGSSGVQNIVVHKGDIIKLVVARNSSAGDVAGVNLTFQLTTTSAGTASIAGKVFADGNGNGKPETDSIGLLGWRVYIDQNSNGKFDSGERSALTDHFGNYSITSVVAGTYKVRVVGQSGWRLTTAASVSVSLITGQHKLGVLFGEQPI